MNKEENLMGSALRKIVTILFIALFIFLGLKGCLKTVIQFDKTEVYRQINETGESFTVYVIPKNTIILKKQFKDQYEYAVYRVRGTDVTHYFGPLYHQGETLWGFRLYPKAKSVWEVEMELNNKGGNLQSSTFKDIGTSFNDIIIFRDKSIDIGHYTYEKLQKTSLDDLFINLARR